MKKTTITIEQYKAISKKMKAWKINEVTIKNMSSLNEARTMESFNKGIDDSVNILKGFVANTK